MGAISCSRENLTKDSHKISLNLFRKLYPIGKGGFGRVWKIQLRKAMLASSTADSNGIFALKEMSKKISFNEAKVKFIVSNILLALKYIHSKHIIHRDLKPENLVFDSKGYLHLTDFGISHEYNEGDELVDASGTPGYMAPEIVLRKPHDYSVDFFGLGVIIYELITGKRPYSGRLERS